MTFLLLGLAFRALAVIVMAVSIIGHVVQRPIRKARAGGALVPGGNGTALVGAVPVHVLRRDAPAHRSIAGEHVRDAGHRQARRTREEMRDVLMAAECEVDDCGVLAIGRCARCGRAMCTSHRAHEGDGGPIVNQCSECWHALREPFFPAPGDPDHPDVRLQREQRAREQVKNIARRLAQAGFQPGSPASEGKRPGRGLFGRPREAREPGSGHRGWPVGQCCWEVPDDQRKDARDSAQFWAFARAFVTADGELMMEGGHVEGENGSYIPFSPGLGKKRAEPVIGEPELWEGILSTMIGLARRHGAEFD